MKVSFGGLGETVATFYNSASAGAATGELVKMSGNGEIAACSANNAFCGVCVSADEEYAAVQVGGFVSVPYAGSDPALGFVKLAASDKGKVKVDATNGRECLVIERDTAAKTVGFIL